MSFPLAPCLLRAAEGEYQPYPDDMPAETCEGSTYSNNFYGSGEVNALATVRR